MLFKNARLYRLLQAPDLDARLDSDLDAARLRECGKLEPASVGWTSPYGRGHETLVHSAGGCHLIRFGALEKVLPPVVIREALADRVSQARERTGHPPGRREKLKMKDEVLMDLLPRAFVKPRHVDAYLDPGRGLLVVDSASARAAEDLVMLLRQNVEGLKIAVPDLSERIVTRLTSWLEAGQCPDGLDLGDECDLREDRDERATVRCRHQELDSPEIIQHLKAGKRAQRLGLTWQDSLSFALGEDLALARIKPLDLINDQLEAIDNDDAMAELDARFALTTGTLGELIQTLAELFDWSS